MKNKNLLIVDYYHLVYKIGFSNAPAKTYFMNGVERDITLLDMSIKSIVKKASLLDAALAVVGDMGKPMARISRTFEELGVVYKEGRKDLPHSFKEYADEVFNVLNASNISTYRLNGFEADDIIVSLVKSQYNNYDRIYLLGNDMDQAWLVDDKVSYFIQNKMQVGIFKGYAHLTKENYSALLESRSAFKGYDMFYNSIYLYKLLRGDSADNIPGVKGLGPVAYNANTLFMSREQAYTPDNFESFILPELKKKFDVNVVMHAQKVHACIAPEKLKVFSAEKNAMVSIVPANPKPVDMELLQVNLAAYGIQIIFS